ncbi:Verru_Chthon cassette protein A [Verrucomicrobium sp. BvORR106]|uniref:Verru_Chthon cassette protein A n=1 Tax=Verrucomicrobium sp. BvORR106 TaxID=1403819 RepID=UPI002240FD56|nr:Verru_Chthon cassette protein A [Verrucomicrobium sp. BvORR106]
MNKRRNMNKGSQQAGMALVMVLAIVALLMGLVLALLSMGSSEARSSSAFSQTSQVRGLTDMPVSIVMGQIREATSGLGMSKTWASQPGMIRVFGTAPGAVAGRAKLETAWRLYSSDKMTEGGDSFNALNEATSLAKWKELPAQFTDLNEPVARLDADGNVHRVYPVLDASVLQTSGGTTTGKVAGFGLSSTVAVPSSTSDQPLPMPVRWLYVLQDGRIVAPDGGEGGRATFKSAEVTEKNPIVGRIAFWTDDESCKVNVNTAGEGTGWDVPRAAGWSDRNFAYFIPAQNEFQRFPGHPAMTSMSTVLQAFDAKYNYQFPAIQSDGTVGNKSAYQTWLRGIYDLLPRVQLGASGESSMGGSEVASLATGVPLKRERLFTSVDEFFYGSGFDAGKNQRLANSSDGTVNAADLEMGRFFLTAHSRAPEVNLYNRPRISLWPVQAEASKRTAKDKLLAFCATSAGQLGAFQRASTWENASTKQGSSQSPTADFQLSGNQMIFSYLQKLTKAAVPGFGTQTFDDKYGSSNRNQILLNMFDFVRWGVNANNPYDTPKYHYIPPRAYTGLNGEYLAEASAVPIVADGTAAESFPTKLKALGRYPTVIEASLIFMATEVETNPDGSPKDTAPADSKADKTKRMRAFLVVQPFTPVVGMPPYTPNVRYRIKGMENWKVNSQPLGFAAAGVNRCWVPAGAAKDGGHSTAYTSLHSQFYRARSGALKTVVPGGVGADETNSFPFVSLDVDVSAQSTFQFTGGPVTIETHLGEGAAGQLDDSTLIQTATLNFISPTGPWPVPTVRVNGSMPSNANWTVAKECMDLQMRFNKNDPQNFLIVLGDTVRSVVTSSTNAIAKGDFRIMCAMRSIPQDCYTPHADYSSPTKEEAQSLRHAGSAYTGHYGRTHAQSYLNNTVGKQHTWQMAGYVIGADSKVSKPYGLLRDVAYWQDCQPSTPYRLDGAYNSSNRPGDWDTGMGRIEDGPYINKPDDTGIKGTTGPRDGYFARDGFTDESTARTYSPNRQICSAIAFGSLPSAVHPVPANSDRTGPWQTLLFCPNPPSRVRPANLEPIQTDHWGFRPPRDHLLLDFFWMPVVEPYAISEPFSTGGKINLNSQIVPFSYIRRDTSLYAALRSVRINAMPSELAWAKDALTSGANAAQMEESYKTWQNWLKFETVYEVNAEETMKGFRQRFDQGDIFRSASEICDIFLVPKPMSGRTYYPRADGLPSSSPTYETMVTWWNGSLSSQKDGFELTGDNVRESPYNQLYPRLTTKSNIFTVHYRVQVLKKARSSAADEWNESKDAVTAEQRGSSIIERYIDPNDPELPNYFANPSQSGALDDYYRFRVITRKTFMP